MLFAKTKRHVGTATYVAPCHLTCVFWRSNKCCGLPLLGLGNKQINRSVFTKKCYSLFSITFFRSWKCSTNIEHSRWNLYIMGKENPRF